MQSAVDLYILMTFVLRNETASIFIQLSYSFELSLKALTSGGGGVFKLCQT